MLAGALAAGALILLPSYRYLLVVFKSHPERRRMQDDPALPRTHVHDEG